MTGSPVARSRIKIVLIGTGQVAQDIHLAACRLLPDVDLVAACDTDSERLGRFGQRAGISALYADPAEALERERPDIAILATPPGTHRDLCLLALGAGVHVFCEKPFVLELPHADEIVEAARVNERSVIVNTEYRFLEIYSVVRESIVADRFGSPFFIQCWQQMHHPPSTERNWRADMTRYTLNEFGCHVIDLMCFLFADQPVAITAHTPHPRPDIAADAVVQASLRFPGERLATVSLNRLSHALERYLEMRIDCERASVRISFGGVARAGVEWSRRLGRPQLRASFVRGGEVRVESGGRSRILVRQPREGRPQATAANLRSQIEGIRQGHDLGERLREARDLIRVIQAGYESATTGETVRL